MAGQLFERWAALTDHDLLDVLTDMELLSNLTDPSTNTGQSQLLRAGGYRPGSVHSEHPEVCGAALAAMLLAANAPNTAFYACMPSFNSIDGWMDMDKDISYDQFLGAPLGKAVLGTDGLMRRAFEGANVTLNTTSFISGYPSADTGLNRGCVQWSSGVTTGTCPKYMK